MSIPAVGFPLAISLGFISSFLKANALSTDYSECAVNANRTYWKAPNATFLYDQYGKPTDNVSRAWGISYQSCQALCKTPINFDKYNWNLLSQSLTSWFLPWLALTAQLPFETKDKQTNFAALILALGSPSLITFSLTLTILNARWINRNFRLIREEAGSLRPHRPILMKAVEAARAFLIDSQHVPIQIFNGPRREIAHLIACPQNWAWWLSLYEEAQKSKRRWTYSLYAQIGWVCVEQLLAIVTYLLSASSASSIGIGLAINSLWIWMVPVILGWVYVGTQTSAGSIKAAIVAVVVPVLGQETNVSGECIGIRDRTTFDESCTKPRKSSGNCRRCCDEENRKVRRESSSQQHIELPRFSRGIQQTANTSSNPEEPSRLLLEDEPDDQCSCSPHTFLGFSIAGSDLEPGPIFNYARIWGHMNAVQHVIDAFRTIIQRQQKERTVHGQLWNHDLDGYDGNFRSSPQELSRYISKFDKDEPNLSIQGVSSSNLVLNCITAAFFAVFLQWSSTGAAMVIAYRTPVVGLGCQSGSYLIYGLIATVVWLTLFFSAFLSHRWSRQMETWTIKPHWILGPSAVMLRLVGNALAAANAIFLVVTCVAQFTGLYDTCWCDACIPSLGRKAGWVILFANDAQIVAASNSAWKGGVALSVVSAAIVTSYFLTSRGDEIFKRNRQ